MASEDIKAKLFTCDGCGKRVMLENGEVPYGYHGQAYEHAEWGGTNDCAWWACKPACIRKAVLNVIKRDKDAF